MTSTSNSDTIPNRLLALSNAQTTPIGHWKFVPGGILKLNNKEVDIYLGEVYYSNPLYQIMNAVKIKDWVFLF